MPNGLLVCVTPMGLDKSGSAYGIAWAPTGSQLIQIKTTITKGSGKVSVECDVGHDFLLSLEQVIEYLQEFKGFNLNKSNIKIFIPGSLDGLSAGLPILVSIYSALTKTPVNQNLALTGALYARGLIVGVAEIASKLKAVARARMMGAILPMDNLKDLPVTIFGEPLTNIYLGPVQNVEEALALSLPEYFVSTKLIEMLE